MVWCGWACWSKSSFAHAGCFKHVSHVNRWHRYLKRQVLLSWSVNQSTLKAAVFFHGLSFVPENAWVSSPVKMKPKDRRRVRLNAGACMCTETTCGSKKTRPHPLAPPSFYHFFQLRLSGQLVFTVNPSQSQQECVVVLFLRKLVDRWVITLLIVILLCKHWLKPFFFPLKTTLHFSLA